MSGLEYIRELFRDDGCGEKLTGHQVRLVLNAIAEVEAELYALRNRVRELEQGNLEEGPFGWGMREGGEK